VPCMPPCRLCLCDRAQAVWSWRRHVFSWSKALALNAVQVVLHWSSRRGNCRYGPSSVEKLAQSLHVSGALPQSAWASARGRQTVLPMPEVPSPRLGLSNQSGSVTDWLPLMASPATQQLGLRQSATQPADTV
jgi:hypothetical protein